MAEEAKVTALEDWGIFDNESKVLPQKEEKEEEIPKKNKGKKMKLKEEEKNNEEIKENKKKQNNVYKTIYTHMKNIQPDAYKSIKRKTYEILKKYVEENDLDDSSYDLIIKGDDKSDILGLCK